VQHCEVQPDLSPLRAADQPVVGRALAKDPLARFASCLEFVQALQGQSAGHPAGARDAQPRVPVRDETLRETPADRRCGHADTPRPGMAVPPVPAALAGYRFLESQASTPLVDA